MPREAQEPTTWETRPTPDVAEVCGILWVPASKIRASTVITLGTTLANFLPGVDKADAIMRGFGSYVLSDSVPVRDGYHGYYFGKPKTEEEAATAFRTSTDVEPSMHWPAVVEDIVPLRKVDGSWDFKPKYKESYDGPTLVQIEEFLSPTPHALTVPETMQPKVFDDALRVGGLAPYNVEYGSLTLKRCLRPAFNFTLTIPSTTIGAITYVGATLAVDATNMTDWPVSLVVDDRQRQVEGVWLRRKVTAYRPG